MKLGCLPYLNVKPLVYTLEHGGLPKGWELVYAPPSQLAKMLESGEIAAAPVSSFATFENPDFGICPDICIAADGPVKSVLLLSKKLPENLDVVAIDTSSLSSASLIKILLAELYNCRPKFVRMPPDSIPAMLESSDAAMVIGDPAMTCPKDGLIVIDLAEQWKRLTGLPAVFALWAGKGITPELVEVLHEARQAGLSRLEEISRQEAARLDLPYEVCYDYLSRIMIYDLGDRQAQGLAEFKKKATEHGLVSVRDKFHMINLDTITATRISSTDAVGLLTHAPLADLAWAADQVCEQKHPGGVRTYVIDRNINYTNICVSGCKFCAFYRKPGADGGYVLTTEQVLTKIKEAADLGATQILMQGGLHPDLGIGYFESLLKEIKSNFDIQIHSLSAPEIVHISQVSGIKIEETIARLREAGLDSLPGGGAEILVDNVRTRVSPAKCSSSQWLSVMRAAGKTGMRATATMLLGMGETIAERISHMDAIRSLQDETNVFTAFIPWTFQPGNTALGGTALGAHEYLRTLAVSRLYLDNVASIQASWVTQGGEIAQLTLKSGANDIGSTMIEENVVAAAGVSHRMSESDLIGLIHRAGYHAAQRSTLYEIIKHHPRPK